MTPRHSDDSDAREEFFELFQEPNSSPASAPKSTQPKRRARNEKKTRRRRRVRRLFISLSVVIVLIGGLAAIGTVFWNEYGDRISDRLGWNETDFVGDGHGEAVITIRQGDIGADVAQTLAEAGVVMTAQSFYELLLEQPTEFMPGSYQLRLEMSAESALAALRDPANRMELTAMVPEGRTVDQTLEIIAAGAQISIEELRLAAENVEQFELPPGVTSLEGWLFPATYEFEPDTTAAGALQQLVNAQKRVLDDLGVAEADRHRILTIAAIVEREAGRHADFGKVSRVIYNRLDQGMRLQMDSTAQYGIGQHTDGSVWSTNEALSDDNPWNTYVHSGLPEGPIANPGRAAIEATLSPEPGDWLYFVAINLDSGESEFTTNLADHEAAGAKLREWCQANPDRGC